MTYEDDVFEIPRDAFARFQPEDVLLIDDLVAMGGSAVLYSEKSGDVRRVGEAWEKRASSLGFWS